MYENTASLLVKVIEGLFYQAHTRIAFRHRHCMWPLEMQLRSFCEE